MRILKAMELLTPEEIVRLSPPERLALIAQLWDSLEHEQLPLTSAQQAELERRLTSLDQNRRDGVTWSGPNSSSVAPSVHGHFHAGRARGINRRPGLV